MRSVRAIRKDKGSTKGDMAALLSGLTSYQLSRRRKFNSLSTKNIRKKHIDKANKSTENINAGVSDQIKYALHLSNEIICQA